MENQQQQQSTTTLCRAGCGFYGSSATEGLCSKCFKDTINKKQETVSSTGLAAAGLAAAAGLGGGLGGAVASLYESANSTSAAASTQTSTTQTEVDTGLLKMTKLSALDSPSLSTSSSSASLGVAELAAAAAAEQSPSTSTVTPDAVAGAKKPNRCQVCKKRVGLTGFPCRCGGLYCGEHRYDTAHDCQFDYKTIEREELRKNNPVVVSEKIQRI